MAEAVYLLCAVTSVLCAALLLRGYLRSRTPLLFWSCLCFGGLAANNVLLFVDLVVMPEYPDLSLPRAIVGVASVAVLLVGLVWEAK